MSDLISRQAAIDKFRSWLKVEGYSEGERNMLKAVLLELQEFPPVEPERKKGNWIGIDDYPYGTWECDQCGCIYEETLSWAPNFCPNCGARMDLKDDESHPFADSVMMGD